MPFQNLHHSCWENWHAAVWHVHVILNIKFRNVGLVSWWWISGARWSTVVTWQHLMSNNVLCAASIFSKAPRYRLPFSAISEQDFEMNVVLPMGTQSLYFRIRHRSFALHWVTTHWWWVYTSQRPTVSLSNRPSVCLTVCLSVCLSICQFTYFHRLKLLQVTCLTATYFLWPN